MAGNTLSLRNHLFVSFVCLALAACGGGGGGSSEPTPTPDSTPDAFSFAAQEDIALGQEVDSEIVTISGINTSAIVSVAGGTVSINGGEFSDQNDTVNDGDTVRLRVTSSQDFGETVTATLTVGGEDGTFSVTTFEPDAFSFESVTDVDVSSESISVTVNVVVMADASNGSGSGET